ncbi:prolipoprotein diacylglyceryl transferase [Schaalia sp. 19OD2882]|uniref:prolipoprotein diacylglyceryl transferase n=1 Tax=Schaalia sp. 19OD2882 TaxID=2794089 RepID=UPI001C1EE337|nr:prolipoprotein diacylglyceryl transferase [Schaalia sp. 19OD2882]QWW20500.1 prolipoprotein diacylglyceryl transferase [Schaalia sp. 19OD2882]
MTSDLLTSVLPASIPSPSQGVWWLGPVPIRAYGIIIMVGMVIGVWWASRRYRARGGNPDVLVDAALWAIPFGIVGARIWHVLTHLQDYFGPGLDPIHALYVWEGGIAIMGAVTGGALGVWIALRRAGARMGPVADSVAPALLLAQAMGRWGNWFNQELFGGPTTLPWGLEIDDAHLPAGYPSGTLFHPTFLYESLWNVAMICVLLWVEKRFRTKSGQLFALYLVVYPLGRFFIENIRLDEAYVFFGLRANAWAALGIFAVGVVLTWYLGAFGAPREVLAEERSDLSSTATDEEAAEGDEADEDEADGAKVGGPLEEDEPVGGHGQMAEGGACVPDEPGGVGDQDGSAEESKEKIIPEGR